jgi:hypothetical protein
MKGWSGRGHIENDCRTKKSESQSKEETLHQAHLALNKEDKDTNLDWAFMVNTYPRTSNPNHWQYDTTCSTHLTPHLNILENVVPDRTKVWDISGGFQWSEHRGSITIKQTRRNVTFHNVLHVPEAPESLLSGQKLYMQGVHCRTNDGDPRLIHNNKKILQIIIVGGRQMVHGTNNDETVAKGPLNQIQVNPVPLKHIEIVPEIESSSESEGEPILNEHQIEQQLPRKSGGEKRKARKLTENSGFGKKSKHIDQRYHYARPQPELRELQIE